MTRKTFFRSVLAAGAGAGLVTSVALAALPPYAQNIRDLQTMVDYVKTNEDVAATIISVNVPYQTVSFSRGNLPCTAHFKRTERPERQGMPGPAAKLEYSHTECMDAP